MASPQQQSQHTTAQPRPSIAAGQDDAQILAKWDALTGPNEVGRGKWEMVLDGKGLRRSFRFKTFNQTWAFMNTVAEQCKVQRHHPEWSNMYNSTKIMWTTHRPEGLTIKDVDMAGFCDEQAKVHGEVAVEDGGECGGCHPK